MKAAAALVVIAVALAACATAPRAPVCTDGAETRQVVQLVFGRNISDAPGVGEEAFARFVDEEITPRFPDGLTVLDAGGQWRGPSGVLVREASKVVMLITPPGGAQADVEAIREAYKLKFRQDAVMLVAQPACVRF